MNIFISGRSLIDIIREIEQPFAEKEGAPNIAGGYQGLSARIIFSPSQHLLGDPHWSYGNDLGQTQLLQCTCGEAGCWPLFARITVEADYVTWDEFFQPHRGPNSRTSHWRYDSLPPFIFERAAYEAALTPTTHEP